MKKIIITAIAVVLLLAMVFPSAVTAQAGIIRVPYDYPTIQAAVTAASPGDTIRVSPGEYAGAVIDKPVIIEGIGKAAITSGVSYNTSGSSLQTAFRLDAGADGTEIHHLIIPNNTDNLYFFAVFSRYVDDVSIHHLTITDSVQGISNYNGSGWNISHNSITGTNAVNGGGIGIMINAWDGTGDYVPDTTEANNNVIMHNYTEGDVGDVGFSGPGILLSSGHGSYQYPGGTLTGNIVYKNRCVHTGTNGVGFEVDDVPFEMGEDAAITGNSVVFNGFRGSTYPMIWYGDENENIISRNFTDIGLYNRGEGNEGATPPDIFN